MGHRLRRSLATYQFTFTTAQDHAPPRRVSKARHRLALLAKEGSLRTQIPPLKTQGIKTKLVPFIRKNIPWEGKGKWIEPFLGSGVVLFNMAPREAIVGDTNAHVINLYQSIQAGRLSCELVRRHLEREGRALQDKGEAHYYFVRDRFNESHSPLDFLFLNRSCFNGLIRFNGNGRFNTPFCRKPDRFRKAYVTKITNQVAWIAEVMKDKRWRFLCCDWRKTLSKAGKDDFVYADPPYAGRFTDYFNKWTDADAQEFEKTLKAVPCRFGYSMWAQNKYRRNDALFKSFAKYQILTFDHFYHLGSTESLRNPIKEALVLG